MKHWIPLLALVALLASCASVPERNAALDNLEARLMSAQTSTEVTRHATQELAEAENAVAEARQEWLDDGESAEFRHELYVAQRRLDIAETKANVAAETARAEELAETRQQLQLRTRTAVAEHERAVAEQDRAIAEAIARGALTEAEVARMERNEAALIAERALEQKEAAQDRAESSRARAESAQARAESAEEEVALLVEQVGDLEAKPTERGTVLTLTDVLFDSADSDLKPGGERVLNEIATFLNRHPDRKVRVEGFTDSQGGDAYNQMLSERRVEVVKDTFIELGVDRERIEAQGYGERFPVTTNETDEGRQQNRRVEIIISDDERPVEPLPG